jgi:hypothetical protein
MTPKAGKRDELIAMMSSPPTGAAANGYRGGYVLKADEGDDVVVAVMYDDKDAYFAMVHDPQTDENLRQDHGAARGRADVDRRGVARSGGLSASATRGSVFPR